jgi:hypothetical protein
LLYAHHGGRDRKYYLRLRQAIWSGESANTVLGTLGVYVRFGTTNKVKEASPVNSFDFSGPSPEEDRRNLINIACHRIFVSGKVDQSDAIRYYPEDMKSGFILICSAKPLSDLCLKTHQKKNKCNNIGKNQTCPTLMGRHIR